MTSHSSLRITEMESNDNRRDFEVICDPAPAAGAKIMAVFYGYSLRYVPP
jgi:hypothetical protein